MESGTPYAHVSGIHTTLSDTPPNPSLYILRLLPSQIPMFLVFHLSSDARIPCSNDQCRENQLGQQESQHHRTLLVAQGLCIPTGSGCHRDTRRGRWSRDTSGSVPHLPCSPQTDLHLWSLPGGQKRDLE